jgi:hypothetical protein
MRSNIEFEAVKNKHYGIPNYDYRCVYKTFYYHMRGEILIGILVAHHTPNLDLNPIRRTAA